MAIGYDTLWASMGSYYDFYVFWNIESQDVEANTSKVYLAWGVRKKAANSSTYNYNTRLDAAYGSTTVYGGTVAWDMRSSSVGAERNLYTQTVTVEHNADGTKQLYLYGGINPGNITGASKAEISQYVTLPAIPRATTPVLSASSADMGASVTIDLTGAAASSFVHDIVYTQPNGTVTAIAANVGSVRQAWTVPDVAAQIPNATSVPLTVTVTTKDSSGAAIGSKTVTLTATVPASVVPAISAVAVTEGTSRIAAQFGAYIQSKSRLKVAITAAGAKGSTISSISSVLEGVVYGGASWTSGIVSGSGTLSIVTTVTDSRGRTASRTTSVTVLAYSAPTIPRFAVKRVDQYGKTDTSGTYVSIRYSYSVTSLGGKNTASMTIKYKRATASSYADTIVSGTDLSADTTTQPTTTTYSVDYRWDFLISVTDWFGSTTTATVQIQTAEVILDFLASGRGLAIGKTAEKAGLEIAKGWTPSGNLGAVYGTCSTAASTRAKVVACDEFGLHTGARIAVKFTYGQEYATSAPTLNVNGTGAKSIRMYGTTAAPAYIWRPGEVVEFVYDGSYWVMVLGGVATDTYYGRTRLATAVGSDTDRAITPKAVQTALLAAKPHVYEPSGRLLNSAACDIAAVGSASILIIDGLAKIDFSVKITAETTTQTYAWGLNRDLLKSLGGYSDTITPASGGVVTYYNADGTINDSLTGYGGRLDVNAQFWVPARVYTAEGGVGAWNAASLKTGCRLVGTCYGTAG